MAETVRKFVVTEKGAMTVGVGDTVYECDPGTVLYEPWLDEQTGIGIARLADLGIIAAIGTAPADEVPDVPDGGRALVTGDGEVDRLDELVAEAAAAARRIERAEQQLAEATEALADAPARVQRAEDALDDALATQAEVLDAIAVEEAVAATDGGGPPSPAPATAWPYLYAFGGENTEDIIPDVWPPTGVTTDDGRPLYTYFEDVEGQAPRADGFGNVWHLYTGPTVAAAPPPPVETPVVETPVVETPVVETPPAPPDAPPVVEAPPEAPVVEAPPAEAPVVEAPPATPDAPTPEVAEPAVEPPAAEVVAPEAPAAAATPDAPQEPEPGG